MYGCLVVFGECALMGRVARVAARIRPAWGGAITFVVCAIAATSLDAADAHFRFDIPAQPVETAPW